MMRGTEASGSHLDLDRVLCVLYGVKYIDLVSLAVFAGVEAVYGWDIDLTAPTVSFQTGKATYNNNNTIIIQ